MDYYELETLVNLSEKLVAHPHLSYIRELVNRELTIHNREAGDLLKQLKAQQASSAAAEYQKILKDEEAKAANPPTAQRDIQDGVPGPAESAVPDRDIANLQKPKVIPTSDMPIFTSDEPMLPNVDRR